MYDACEGPHFQSKVTVRANWHACNVEGSAANFIIISKSEVKVTKKSTMLKKYWRLNAQVCYLNHALHFNISIIIWYYKYISGIDYADWFILNLKIP